MNNNPIEELRDLKVPVSEQEWESIVHDKRYLKKFGKGPKLSPKSRAALIAGAAAVLITVPILFNTLSHKTTDTAQDNRPVTQVAAPKPEAVNEPSVTVPPVNQIPAVTHRSETPPQMLPSASSFTTNAATHEQSTLTTVTEARVPSDSRPVQTTTPAVSVPAIQPPVIPTPMESLPVNGSNNLTIHTDFSDNLSQPEDAVLHENWPMTDKRQYESDTVILDEKFFIPSGFTPNGDNNNEYFFVKANFVPRNFEMNILNRNGELVFHSRDINSQWDGKIRGQTLPSGMYVYIITYTDSYGNLKKEKGQVMLLY